jgi:hypothetical protein
LKRPRRVFLLAAHDHVRLSIDDLRDSKPNDGVIVNNQNASLIAWFLPLSLISHAVPDCVRKGFGDPRKQPKTRDILHQPAPRVQQY